MLGGMNELVSQRLVGRFIESALPAPNGYKLAVVTPTLGFGGIRAIANSSHTSFDELMKDCCRETDELRFDDGRDEVVLDDPDRIPAPTSS